MMSDHSVLFCADFRNCYFLLLSPGFGDDFMVFVMPDAGDEGLCEWQAAISGEDSNISSAATAIPWQPGRIQFPPCFEGTMARSKLIGMNLSLIYLLFIHQSASRTLPFIR
ncbi:MAG: hypothetical protein ACI4WR_02335 [Bulleidia sp.]